MKVVVSKSPSASDLSLVPGENLVTGIQTFCDEFGDITSLEEDLLRLASAIYATDLACKRDEAESYIRDIELDIEVVNIQGFERVKPDLFSKELFDWERELRMGLFQKYFAEYFRCSYRDVSVRVYSLNLGQHKSGQFNKVHLHMIYDEACKLAETLSHIS